MSLSSASQKRIPFHPPTHTHSFTHKHTPNHTHTHTQSIFDGPLQDLQHDKHAGKRSKRLEELGQRVEERAADDIEHRLIPAVKEKKGNGSWCLWWWC